MQPFLRRLFGNSFLPYHDYGRGGRGWRDLWQDCLALLMLEPEPVHDLLFSNFAGVRVDGSNATIIGSRPGEFKADRNNIPRVWMDHGAWPYLTTRLYIDSDGDLALPAARAGLLQRCAHQSLPGARCSLAAGAGHPAAHASRRDLPRQRAGTPAGAAPDRVLQRRRAQQHPPGRRGLERRHGHGPRARRERGLHGALRQQPARPERAGARPGPAGRRPKSNWPPSCCRCSIPWPSRWTTPV